MSFHRFLPLAALIAVSAAPAPSVAAPAHAVTSVGYDPSLGAVVVQFRGDVPRYHVGRLLQRPCSYVDLLAPTQLGVQGGRLPGHSLLLGWGLSRRTAAITRVSLTFRRDARMRVEPDLARHRLLLYPLEVGRPAVARTPAPPSPTPFPSPEPEAVTPSPSPIATPSAPPPAPTASPSLPPGEPASVSVRATVGWMSYRENNVAGDTQVQLPSMAVPGFAIAYRLPTPAAGWLLPDWYGMTAVSTAAYAFQDRDLPVSIHARQEWRGETSFNRRLGWPNLHLDLGAGYVFRYESAAHSAAPPTPSYLFSSMRVFHGPELRAGLGWRLAEDWPTYLEGMRIFSEAAIAPYIFSSLDAGLKPLPPVAMGRSETGLEHRLGPVGLRLAYRTWWTGSFGGYEEFFQGPVVSIASDSWPR